MKQICIAIAAFFLVGCNSHAQDDRVFLFAYFKGRGDGLHLAYSKDGLRWSAMFNDSTILKPQLSKDKLFRDPCIVKGGDGKWHMVWTVSWNDKGIGYASSDDLFHWSEQQYLPVMQHEDSARNAWAPEINYDPQSGEYLLYWATTISGRFPSKDTAAESGYNHRIYATTTKDFKTFNPTKLFYEPGFSVIDASIVKHADQYIMFLKNETRSPVEKNIRMATAKALKGPYSQPGDAITGKYWAEGPTALFNKSKWIVYFDKYRDHKYGALQSSDLEEWEDISDKIELPPGIRHGTTFSVSVKEFDRLNAYKLPGK